MIYFKCTELNAKISLTSCQVNHRSSNAVVQEALARDRVNLSLRKSHLAPCIGCKVGAFHVKHGRRHPKALPVIVEPVVTKLASGQ